MYWKRSKVSIHWSLVLNTFFQSLPTQLFQAGKVTPKAIKFDKDVILSVTDLIAKHFITCIFINHCQSALSPTCCTTITFPKMCNSIANMTMVKWTWLTHWGVSAKWFYLHLYSIVIRTLITLTILSFIDKNIIGSRLYDRIGQTLLTGWKEVKDY